MSALTGPRIRELVAKQVLVIDPFHFDRVNPNSYNLEIADDVVLYEKGAVVHDLYEQQFCDAYEVMVTHGRRGLESLPPLKFVLAPPLSKSKEEPTVLRRLQNPGDVPTLDRRVVQRFWPGVLYLLRTKEYTETPYPYRPHIDGRSSVGRLGEFVHVTAGYGDVGFKGTWTLEVAVVQPVEVQYPLQSCQISYTTVDGPPQNYQSPKYQGQRLPQPSRLWKEVQRARQAGPGDVRPADVETQPPAG